MFSYQTKLSAASSHSSLDRFTRASNRQKRRRVGDWEEGCSSDEPVLDLIASSQDQASLDTPPVSLAEDDSQDTEISTESSTTCNIEIPTESSICESVLTQTQFLLSENEQLRLDVI